ncbi:DUF262 domain-containing protein [Sneathiella sp.]|uniref:DUF262 domain-containing protein n=1 Tax=Sneathiella sp. TaxID=1964365 RepID=UPI00260AE8C4|nr:DUF262 domain-containing protein [Sneathiella sp.]MDF2367860.1 DUF262 domain-containing protein [Sneathiella sp.]
MSDEKPIYEIDEDFDDPDPDQTPLRDRKVVTQPYDLAVAALVDQIKSEQIFLRPLNDRPNFQRKYVWTNTLASRLVESILLNVPIPPCYLSQNEEYEFDVIDGQQRLYSLYRYLDNQFPLTDLEVLSEFRKLRFHELPSKDQRKLKTYTLRCIVITNESHPEIKFDVFQRLNSNTVPLNAQELRNCIHRGEFNNLLGELASGDILLKVLKKKMPDKRLRDEELILRFFAFHNLGLEKYRTPLKHWFNEAAKIGRSYTPEKIQELKSIWNDALEVATILFHPEECFRRDESRAINRALFDLIMYTAKNLTVADALKIKVDFKKKYNELNRNEEFQDLISRSVDHKKRTLRRFEIWNGAMKGIQ